MELRRYLFEHGLTQATVVKVARDRGYALDAAWLSRIVNGVKPAQKLQRSAIRDALLWLGARERDVDRLNELKAPK